MNHAELTDQEYARFRDLIYRAAGIQIADNKRAMVGNRVRRRLRATGLGDFTAYLGYLASAAGEDEMPLFLDAITTNETYFFRDPHHYDWLGDVFLPEILALAEARKRPRTLRVWSAACSTGEEPYSIALKWFAKKPRFTGWKTTILGTDLSGAVLEAAALGSYDARSLRLVDPATLKSGFTAAADRFVVNPEVRGPIVWKRHNLLKPLDEGAFDCVFIKNVLIYFDNESKRTVVANVTDSLAKGGYLVVGPTEGIHNMLGSLARIHSWLYQRLV